MITWSLNGVDISTLTIDKLKLTLENQRPDRLTFEIPTERFDTEILSYALGSEVVLTRTQDGGAAVTWFRGVVRQTPRTAEPYGEFVGYVVEGPWQWFERIAYLQNFKTPSDPADVGSALTTYLRGRTILGQSDAGAKVNVGAFLNSVFDYVKTAADAFHGSAVMQRPDFSAIAGLQVTIPWDEVVDLQADEVLSRVLQFLPDAVCWWDYTTSPPTLNINRRSALAALSLGVIPHGAPRPAPVRIVMTTEVADVSTPTEVGEQIDGGRVLLTAQADAAENGIYDYTSGQPLDRSSDANSVAELNKAAVDVREGEHAGETWVMTNEINDMTDESEWAPAVHGVPLIRERPDLQREGVVLIYVKTHRANEAMWETHEVDAHPIGANPSSPAVLVRTIQLAGSVANETTIAQPIEVDAIPTGTLVGNSDGKLRYDSADWLSSGAQFDTLRDWWHDHAPELQLAGVQIKGFAKCLRTGTSMGTAGQLNRELVAGAITEWMKVKQNIDEEEQIVSAYIAYEETDPANALKKARRLKRFVARITATNAQTKTYVSSHLDSFTPDEETPVGLAAALYDAIGVMEYEGSIRVTEREPSRGVIVGRKLNLGGGLAAWSTMNAIAQRGTIDIARGETTIYIGPPNQLGPGDRIELYRANRNRQPVTSYLVRTTGKSGGGTTRVAGLGVKLPRGAKASGNSMSPRVWDVDVTYSGGAVPEESDIKPVFENEFDEVTDRILTDGDTINVRINGVLKFRYVITVTNPGTTGKLLSFSFTVNSVTYYAQGVQVGIY